jgi:hypothetical protein
MKKAFVFAVAVMMVSGPMLARASIFEILLVGARDEDRTDSLVAAQKQNKHVDSTAFEANCREVEVEMDEGYGVSSHESRHVCNP